MKRLGTRYAALCTFAFSMAHAALAAAADEAPLQIPYTAPSECPKASAFMAELAMRGVDRRADGLHGPEHSRQFSVRIEKRGPVFEGELTVAHDGSLGTRRVQSADCAAVVRSLAVFVALALAERSEPVPPESTPRAELPPPPPPPPPTPRAASTPPRPAPAHRAAPPAASGFWRFESGIQTQYARVGADAFGARVSAEWSRHFASSPIAPALRLSWGFSTFGRPVDAGEIHSRLQTARAEMCGGTIWWRTHSSLCAAFELGQLAVSSSGLPRTGRAESSWSAAGLVARTRVIILDPVGVELALGLFIPFERAEFTLIDPVRQVYRVPSFSFDGQLGIAVATRWN